MTVLVCWMIAAATAQPNPDFDAFFADFAKRRDEVRSLEAKFVQETVTADDPAPEKKTGTITYVKPRRILFKYDDPEITYLVDGQKVYEYNAKATQLQIIDLENDPQTEAFFLGFDDNTERLKQAYDVTLYTPDAKECGSKGLELVPKQYAEDLTKKQQKTFEKVRISLDGKQYLPCHITIVNDKDSKSNITISSIKVNAESAPKDLTIAVPEHTTIVENNDTVSSAGPGGATFPRPDAPKPPTITLQDLKKP